MLLVAGVGGRSAAAAVPSAGADPGLIGEWGRLTADVTMRDAAGTELIGLRVELLADHGGLPAGSEIRLGGVFWPPPVANTGEQQPAPPPTIKQQPASHRHPKRPK